MILVAGVNLVPPPADAPPSISHLLKLYVTPFLEIDGFTLKSNALLGYLVVVFITNHVLPTPSSCHTVTPGLVRVLKFGRDVKLISFITAVVPPPPPPPVGGGVVGVGDGAGAGAGAGDGDGATHSEVDLDTRCPALTPKSVCVTCSQNRPVDWLVQN